MATTPSAWQCSPSSVSAISFVQLSAKLAAFRGVNVTFLTTPASALRVSAMLSSAVVSSLTSPVRIVALELPQVDGLPEGTESTDEATVMGAELLKVALDRMQPRVGALLADLRPYLVIHDFAQHWLHSVAHPLGIKTVYFSVFSAAPTAFLAMPSRGHLKHAGEAVPPPGFPWRPESTIESVPPYQAANFAYLFMHFFGMPSVYDRLVEAMQNCSAIAFKTCMDVEGPYIRSIEKEYNRPVFLAVPLVPEPPAKEDLLDPKWAQWLDRFPEESVIFCSFGSETFLSDEAIRELALGLTDRPFLLVINFPKAKGKEPAVDGLDGDDPLRGKLPEGLEGRVAGRGMFYSGWVPQKQILSHKSVGCFLCLLMEGFVTGCQLVLLPQKGDQILNARLFAGDLLAAVEVRRRDEDWWFGMGDTRDAVSKTAADDEKGRQVRENHRRWRDFFAAEDVNQRFMADFVVKLRDPVSAEG